MSCRTLLCGDKNVFCLSDGGTYFCIDSNENKGCGFYFVQAREKFIYDTAKFRGNT